MDGEAGKGFRRFLMSGTSFDRNIRRDKKHEIPV
jgi:hypothetical protein